MRVPALLGALAVLSALLYRLLRRRERERAQVLFFPVEPVMCARPLCARGRGPCECGLWQRERAACRLCALLLTAQRTLDVCVFTISSRELAHAVLVLHRRGVRVRVITDSGHMALAASQVGNFRRAGIEVRHDQDTNYMHHKFAIVDGSILLNGSLNWSSQAIYGNKENVIVVKLPDIVNPFVEEFESLWNEYDPSKFIFSPQK
ncbi:mitochondrial cardiolipin hydrolase [Callorhinchus milii]|uniref:Mitochondrial cardiolipin hydrolase n=1 Tax=Callorhinchus milii TaxID=7868 RepID=A0A4W3HNY6_CALMI|nr:mitochondrial cardiolipin hydrolase [Callorhinchus milii]|eukprot:gi/632952193/ref/XP_007891720.1/ PREDICTED: mitochondrial cardiolipin hydrolase [Callorhinchus milii]